MYISINIYKVVILNTNFQTPFDMYIYIHIYLSIYLSTYLYVCIKKQLAMTVLKWYVVFRISKIDVALFDIT